MSGANCEKLLFEIEGLCLRRLLRKKAKNQLSLFKLFH